MSISDKRHTIKLETLTPVHIGSGAFLQNNVEFVEDKNEDGDSDIYIIDPVKVVDIIGVHNIDTWVTAIEKEESIKGLISRLGKRATPESYSKRVLTNFAKLSPKTTLKECMHDGRGIAYIPGSSIKGAIRTAVLASLAMDKNNELSNKINLNNKQFACSNVESELFGKTPFENIFRFLQVGDAYFDRDCEKSLNEVNLNIREKESLIDTTKSQLIEAIAEEKKSTLSIKLASKYARHCAGTGKVKSLPKSIDTIENLFDTINRHTQRLIEEEIEYWDTVSESHTGADNYIENLENLLETVNGCIQGKQCVLRVGHASGWRFTTGAWTEKLPIFKNKIVPMSRPKNDKYEQYDFPKTRRVGDEYSDIFGFVKLTIAE